LGGTDLFTAPNFGDPNKINSFLSSLVLPAMETFKYRGEVKTFLKYTARRVKRVYRRIKLKGTKLK
jgi:hypothetical protein